MLARKHDWATRLQCFLSEHQRDRFAYGRLDCCLFVADAVQAMTGTDIAAAFRERYQTRKEAMSAAKAYTGKASVAAIAEQVMTEHAMPTVPVLCAQRGDVALVKRGRDYSLGLVDLDGQHVLAIAKAGFLRLDLKSAVAAWRV